MDMFDFSNINIIPEKAIDKNGEFVTPKDWQEVPAFAFSNLQNLKKVVITDLVTRVNYNAFYNCGRLLNVEFGNNLTELCDGAFYGCNALDNVTLPNNLRVIGSQAFDGCKSLKNVVFNNSLKSIKTFAFTNSSITRAHLPESLEHIDDGAFCTCFNLEEVVIPKKIDYLGEDTFYMCGSLKDVYLPSKMYSIGDRCFASCYMLSNIYLPDEIKELGAGTFASCLSLKNIDLPNGLQKIGSGCFNECSLKSITLPKNLTELGIGVFANNNKLKSVNINSSLTYLPYICFMNCKSLTSITIPQNIKEIKESCFLGCKSLQKVELCEGVEKIHTMAFGGCENLKEINLPNSVEYVGEDAFCGCKKLNKITLSQNVDFKAKLPFSPAYISVLNNKFVITKQKQKNAFKCYDECVGLLLLKFNNKENLLQEFKNDTIKKLYSSMHLILPKLKFEEFFKTKNLKFYSRLYDACNLAKLNDKEFTQVIKFLYNLGAFSPKQSVCVTSKSGTKMVDVFPAQKVCEYFINLNYNFKDLLDDDALKTLLPNGYKPEYTDFVLSGNNLQDLITTHKTKKDNFFAKCYNEFEEVQKTNTSNKGSQRQLKPTVKKFADYFTTCKFEGVNQETLNIALAISPYFSKQETFESAKSVMQEFKETSAPKSLINLDKYKNIDQLASQVVSTATQILGKVKETIDDFSYEWLYKDDERNLILGKFCDCCSHLEGQGYGIMRAGVVHSDVQNMVIKNKDGEIVAKATLYVNPKGHYGVFNTVSVKEKFKTSANQIHQKFIEGANFFANAYNAENPNAQIQILTVGMNLNGIEKTIKLKNKKSKELYKSLNYGAFGESGKRYRGDSDDLQYVVWESEDGKCK